VVGGGDGFGLDGEHLEACVGGWFFNFWFDVDSAGVVLNYRGCLR